MTEQAQRKRIGIFGGSFNPVHTGHICLARQILTAVSLDGIWFMVSPLNPFKQDFTDLLPDDVRLELTREALKDEPCMLASDYEFSLPRPSYMWNTLAHLSYDYPQYSFTLIVGADNWLAFDRWARHDFIQQHYDIAVYPRKGYDIDTESLPSHVKLVQAELYPFSSTDIRTMVHHGQSIKGLVPDSILSKVKRLYR